MNSEYLKKFGNRLKEKRIEKGMTQEELAIKAGYKSRQAISLFESGLRDPTLEKCAVLAMILGTTPHYLMGWNEEDK